MILYDPKTLNDLILPPHYKFRQFKIFYDGGKCIKINKSINKKEDLFGILQKIQPDAFYVSVSRFYNPSKLSHMRKNWFKAGFKWSSNIFLGGELVIDFDEKKVGMIEKAIKILKEHWDFERFEQIETRRGFHLWVMDFEKIIKKQFDNPFERENHFKQIKRKVLYDLEKQGIEFDFPVSVDTRRIVRVPNSIYRKEGFERICNVVNLVPQEANLAFSVAKGGNLFNSQ